MNTVVEINPGSDALEIPKINLLHSLRFRILAIVAGFVLLITVAFTAYTIEQFGESTELSILHEGLLLSDTIESSIGELAGRDDIRGIQAYLDRLAVTRQTNDIEINVLFLREDYSDIVASNNADNLEAADHEEHLEILDVLKTGKPSIFIDTEYGDVDADDNLAARDDPSHPDYYFPTGYRFISITTPLISKGRGVGSVNTKLSLRYLDQKLAVVYRNIGIVLCAGLVLLIGGMVTYLKSTLFNPLWNVAQHIQRFGIGALREKLNPGNRHDEIGVLVTEFNNMVERITKAESLNRQYQKNLQQLVMERTSELAATQEATIQSMALLAEYRDPETGGHIQRTQNYVKTLAEELRGHPKFRDYFDEETIELLYKSAPLHDIGKVGIADRILLKPGKLTDEEFEEMKKHTTFGRDAIAAAEEKLGSNSFLRFAKEIAYSHQEKWDGTGYPQNLKGDEIPVSGRLMAVADVYDALISRRCYKPPFTHDVAVDMISQGKGSHFDPDMVDTFLKLSETFRDIAIKYADSDEEREAVLRPQALAS